VSSLPSLGPRGEGWVAIQGVLLVAIFVGGIAEGSPPWAAWTAASVVGAVLVLGGGVFALLGVLDARVDPDEHDPPDVEIGFRHNVQRNTRPQGVAEQVAGLGPDGGAHRLRHEAGRRRQIGAHGVGTGVPGQVQCDRRVRLGQPLAHGSPQPCGLCEAVQEHDRWPRSAHLDVESHAE